MSNHSTQNLQEHNVGSIDHFTNSNNVLERPVKEQASGCCTLQDSEEGETRKEPLRWPTAAARKEWELVNGDIDQVLKSVPAGCEGIFLLVC